MRIDSCRSCGKTLQEFQSCTHCKESIQFICPQCRKIGDVLVHPQCRSRTAIAN